MNWRHCWVVLKWNIWATTLKACWSRRPKRTELPRVPVHGVAAGMEREASRGMESRLKQARFPWVKTLEQFDFGFQPGIDRKVVRELAGLAFVER